MDRYQGKDLPERHTQMEVFREHNKRCLALIGTDFTASPVLHYGCLMRITGEFLLKEYGSEDLYLDELPVHLVEDYAFYMKTVRRCVHNTVMKKSSRRSSASRKATAGFTRSRFTANISTWSRSTDLLGRNRNFYQ